MINPINSVASLSMTRNLGAIDSDSTPTASAAQSMAKEGSFGAVLSNVAASAVDSLKGAEAMSFAGINGTASTREVVDSVMQAQQTLQTAIALRDKVVSAYLEITRMQI